MCDINFQGNFIRKVNIKKLDLDGTYKPLKATFVELTKEDLPTIQQISKDWKNHRIKHVPDIVSQCVSSSNMLKASRQRFLPNTKGMKKENIPGYLSSRILGNHIYAVTTQTNNFEKLNPDSILGIAALYIRPHSNSLDILEVRPDCISEKYGNQVFLFIKNKLKNLFGIKNTKPKRPYGNVGDSIMKTLLKMYNDNVMELVPLNGAKSFYRRHGFHLNPQTDFEYIWYPDYR